MTKPLTDYLYLPQSNVTESTRFFLMHQWEHGILGGHACVRVFDPALDGVGYMLKGLSGQEAYESAKFGDRTASLTLSEGLQRVLRSLSHVRDRRLAQHKRRLLAPVG